KFKNPGIGIGSVGPKPIRPGDLDLGSAEPGRARLSQGWVDRPIIQPGIGLDSAHDKVEQDRPGSGGSEADRAGLGEPAEPSRAGPIRVQGPARTSAWAEFP
ncbi:hypothetical protein Taro_037748, partial [Colocasia esculenta]|nr:hypothetical protein [Colocasia esculenta]